MAQYIAEPCNKIIKWHQRWYSTLSNSKKCCFSECNVPILLRSLRVRASWYGSVSITTTTCHKRTEWLHNCSVSLQFYVEHTYTNSPFFPRTISLLNSLPNRCLSENYNMDLFFNKRCYTYFLLDGVIFDVICVSFISEHLTPPIFLF